MADKGLFGHMTRPPAPAPSALVHVGGGVLTAVDSYKPQCGRPTESQTGHRPPPPSHRISPPLPHPRRRRRVSSTCPTAIWLEQLVTNADMYTHSSSSSGSNWSVVSDTPSTPSHAPRSVAYGGLPQTPRTPYTPPTPIFPGLPGYCSPYETSKHNIAHGLMTPPDSPDKVARNRIHFHPSLDAGAQPYPFDVRKGTTFNSHTAHAPAINHPVRRLVLYVSRDVTVEIASGGVPTLADFVAQLVRGLQSPDPVYAGRTKSSALGDGVWFAGLTLQTIDRDTAYCVLHTRPKP
ncbi:hypothetical protein BN946_scf184844.g40 [Trametes cinnabarina]|uniref:Uncharacterized protein n=1 Tax=Pycnoporus cinnabarinus TaxID=5643 RepID=A0A060S9X6_PYCCI|nr:hypothetical protein BN946_scf184844.g40 [Trametes cinnabarina]